MKMRSGWGILEAEPARRDRGVVVLRSPITKLIQVRPRTNDCRPSREVSTQAKLVFPFAPLGGCPDRGGGLLPRGSSPWRGALGSRPLCNREPGRLVPLSHHSGWELAPAGRVPASPPLEFSGETPHHGLFYWEQALVSPQCIQAIR